MLSVSHRFNYVTLAISEFLKKKTMILKYKGHVNLQVDLEIGEQVTTSFYLKEKDKVRTIEDIQLNTKYESGVVVKLSGIEHFLDTGWVIKIPQQQLNFENV